jgi:hypothetical protein
MFLTISLQSQRYRAGRKSVLFECMLLRCMYHGTLDRTQNLTEHGYLQSSIAFSDMQPGAVAGGSCGCVINPDKRSRATVKLNSTDVRAPPIVDTNLLAQQEEVDRMVMCIQKEKLYWEELRGLGFNITEDKPGQGLDLEAAVRLHCVVYLCTRHHRL